MKPNFTAGPATDQLGLSVALSGNTAVIGAPGVNNRSGAVYVYSRQAGRWGLSVILTDPRNVPGDAFGRDVALSGDTALIGVCCQYDAAYVYVGSGAHWRLQASLPIPRPSGSSFGASVALSGSTALVGDPEHLDSAPGRVSVYQRTGTHWRLQATINDPRTTGNDDFSAVLTLSGSTAVVSAELPGTCYVYVRSGARWRLRTTLTSPRGNSAFFGYSLAMSGATIVVSDPFTGKHNVGAVYYYTPSAKGWRLRDTVPAPAVRGKYNFGIAVGVAGKTLAVSDVPTNNVGPGKAFLYAWTGSNWQRKAAITDPVAGADRLFGQSVAVAGSTVLIGAPGSFGAPNAERTAGSVYVYGMRGSRWARQSALTDPRGGPGNAVGASVAISGSTAIVGAWGARKDAGAAYVYARSRGQWRRQATISDPGETPGDFFGAAVAVSGQTVLIGAWDKGYGEVYVYVRSGDRWRRQAILSSKTTVQDFGDAVAISGSTAVIGADDLSALGITGGTAYVFTRSGVRWHPQATFSDPALGPDDGFGDAVALSGQTAVVAASEADNGAGLAFVYQRAGSHWSRPVRLADPAGQPNDGFGTAVGVSGDNLVVGAPGVRDYAGAAYFYGKSGSRWRAHGTVTVGRKGDLAGGFGGAVAITGTRRATTALIGGVSVSGLAFTKHRCGNAFEFARPSGPWRELAKVADPKCSSYDEFGYAVAISGRDGLIGAPGAASDVGSAYVLVLPPP